MLLLYFIKIHKLELICDSWLFSRDCSKRIGIPAIPFTFITIHAVYLSHFCLSFVRVYFTFETINYSNIITPRYKWHGFVTSKKRTITSLCIFCDFSIIG